MRSLRTWELWTTAIVFGIYLLVLPAAFLASFALGRLELGKQGWALLPSSEDDVRDALLVLRFNMYYLRFTYALMAFPYLLLLLPTVSELLLRARPTGYNEQGVLCPCLTSAEVHSRWLIEKGAANVQRAWTHTEESLLRSGQAQYKREAATRKQLRENR